MRGEIAACTTVITRVSATALIAGGAALLPGVPQDQ
jgi:hypothetical protein